MLDDWIPAHTERSLLRAFLQTSMPDISVGTQIFDLVFHPSSSVVYLGLLTGHVKSYGYTDESEHDKRFSLRPSKRSCRALAISEGGDKLWAAGKAKAVL